MWANLTTTTPGVEIFQPSGVVIYSTASPLYILNLVSYFFDSVYICILVYVYRYKLFSRTMSTFVLDLSCTNFFGPLNVVNIVIINFSRVFFKH
jgi:hypothetical protein